MPDEQTAPTFDLQSHSTYSDGALPPAEVVATGRGRRRAAARADRPRHGRRRARGAAQPRVDIELVPAVELSLGPRRRTRTCTSSATGSTTPTARCSPRSRTSARTASAASSRWPTSCARSASPSTPPDCSTSRPGRPHLADALLEDNDLELTQERGLRRVPGPGHADLRRAARGPTVAQAIDVIHAAGGLAVWAHPYWDVEQAERALREFAATASTASRPSTSPTPRSRPALYTRSRASWA